jgi:HEAT repeat protein
VRYAAVTAVGAGKIVAAEPNVRALLASENPYVRRRAVWVLAELGQEASLPVLAGLAENDPAFRLTETDGTSSKEYFVRTAAVAAIQKIGVKG